MQPNARLFGMFSMFFLNNLPDWHFIGSPGQTPLLLTSPSTPQVRILSSSSFQIRQPGKPSIQTECTFEFTLIKQSIIYLSIFIYAPFIGPYNHNFKSGPSVINSVPGVFPLVIGPHAFLPPLPPPMGKQERRARHLQFSSPASAFNSLKHPTPAVPGLVP